MARSQAATSHSYSSRFPGGPLFPIPGSARPQDQPLERRARAKLGVRRFVYGSCSVVLLLVGPVGLFLGTQATQKHPAHPAPKALELAAYPVGSTVSSTATITHGTGSLASASAGSAPLSVTGGAHPGPAAAGQPATGASSAAFSSTIASWYDGRPDACWDPDRRSPLPPGITMWAASRTLRCGTTIEVSGPAGTTRLLIEDHGPWLLPGRDLDLSPQAFTSVAGSLTVGLVTVRYRVIG